MRLLPLLVMELPGVCCLTSPPLVPPAKARVTMATTRTVASARGVRLGLRFFFRLEASARPVGPVLSGFFMPLFFIRSGGLNAELGFSGTP